MDECFSLNNIKALQALLCPETEDSDSEDELSHGKTKKLGPGNIDPPNQSSSEDSEKKAEKEPIHDPKNDQNIWHPSEVNIQQTPDILDLRQVPEYEMKFKQAVTTEDIYLGIGFKTPATASCEWLSIYVKLPGEEMENIELNVESECVDIRSSKYRLHLPTCHAVDPNASSAKWHSNTSTLELTLRMTRELDPVNF